MIETSVPVAASIGSPALWLSFTLFVLFLLVLDLGVFHRRSHAVGMREALGWSVVWIALALLFNGFVWFRFGRQAGLEFFTGYLIEKALSVDNLFVFLVIFSYFSVPAEHQHRVLFYGILGALILRAVFILAGASLLASFHWMLYVFGGLLVFTGLKLFWQREDQVHPERNPLFRLFRSLIPAVGEYRGARFLVREGGRWMATPLLLVLVAIEATDVVFALDSIPAIFAVTRDPFIVYTSNIFAILGLRALFFLLAGAMSKMHYLKTGLALVLVFVGGKMLVADWYKVPIAVSLAVIVGLLVGAVLASLLIPKLTRAATEPPVRSGDTESAVGPAPTELGP